MKTKESIASNKRYDVSVIVATYNAVREKLAMTLASVIDQEDVSFEIIVCDDGSADNQEDYIKRFFEERGFADYVLILHRENQGTVKNLYDGVKQATGQYIKLLSPGDYLAGKSVLAAWTARLSESQMRWSFCNAIYYSMIEGERVIVSGKAHPQLMAAYRRQDDREIRWNYIVLSDIVLGAATLCSTKLMTEYFEKIVNRVIYAEDNIYRLMINDKVIPLYFDSDGIYYEYGTGISTAGSEKWNRRLEADWNTADRIMFQESGDTDSLQPSYLRLKENNHFLRIINKLLTHHGLEMFVGRKLFPRKTSGAAAAAKAFKTEY